MKAITIWQAWASLIMAGAKPWEWRGWPAPNRLVGTRIAIHAGARPVRLTEIAELVIEIRGGASSLVADVALDLLDSLHHSAWPLSSVLGTARLGAPISALAWAQQHLAAGYDSSRIDHHKFAWPLTDIERFEPPIPARGAQGFWNWPEMVQAT
jgi:hypothetical protein